jgi:hypothetical protein
VSALPENGNWALVLRLESGMRAEFITVVRQDQSRNCFLTVKVEENINKQTSISSISSLGLHLKKTKPSRHSVNDTTLAQMVRYYSDKTFDSP